MTEVIAKVLVPGKEIRQGWSHCPETLGVASFGLWLGTLEHSSVCTGMPTSYIAGNWPSSLVGMTSKQKVQFLTTNFHGLSLKQVTKGKHWF